MSDAPAPLPWHDTLAAYARLARLQAPIGPPRSIGGDDVNVGGPEIVDSP